jgi:hypothetical protein
MKTPYSNLPAFQFHSRTMRGAHPSRFDPVTSPKFTFDSEASIMTMGSCFAQHLSQWLIKNQFNLLLREQDSYQGGGMFSANYGNVYTVQQAHQLFDRAFGLYRANDELYIDENGSFFDPLRPADTPIGLRSKQEVLDNRLTHESIVKELFLSADVLVFTLGLTEAWLRSSDGAILPIAPGVIAGEYDENLYEFHNYSYQETYLSLSKLLIKLNEVNPRCEVLLTVSPVPLAATYETKHVSVSSMASKSILRAVVEQTIKEFTYVEYFPSYKIFFTPGIGAGYFDYDARHILPTGISHAMKLFETHYTNRNVNIRDEASLKEYADEVLKIYHNVNCDEGKIS